MPTPTITKANRHLLLYPHNTSQKAIMLAREPGVRPRATAYGTNPLFTPFEEFTAEIPRDKWPERLAALHGKTLRALTAGKLPPHDQGRTNYCWAHGTTRAVEIARIAEHQPPQLLSAESIAVPLTGGVNRGGTIEEAVTQLHQYGACRQKFWPANDRNAANAAPGWKTDRLHHRLLKWIELRTFAQQFSMLLELRPIAAALGWWRHLICQLEPIQYDDGTYGIGFDNSWGPDWGENGYSTLDEESAYADWGAVAAIDVTDSDL